MSRVAAVIFHPGPGPGSGPLGEAFAILRRRNADRHAERFDALGAAASVVSGDGAGGDPGRPWSGFGERLRATLTGLRADGIVVLGSGSVPLARQEDRRAFVDVAAGPAGHALANNRYSADVVAIAGAATLGDLPDLAADNGLPRWLAGVGVEVDDLRGRWRLQVDLDSPLDTFLVEPDRTTALLAERGVGVDRLRAALAAVAAVTLDPGRELLVAGRTSAAGLAWLERSTASRTRALIEERGFRTRPDDATQRPVRSSLGLVLDRDGPAALGARLAELGDAALIDTRVLLAHRFGADERGWPIAEDRFASDLLLPDRIGDPWLRAVTTSALEAPIPVALGGHSLVGPGLRLVVGRARARRTWT